jgi:NAD(P)H dehydrogenase (quinone)
LMSRKPDDVPAFAGVDVVRGDFEEPSSLDKAFVGITSVLVVSGSGVPGQRAAMHKNAFEAAARGGVQHVVYLSLMGASPTSLYPYCRDHYTSETFLSETGLPHTLLRIAFYVDMFVAKLDARGVVRGPGGDGRGAFISREDVAWAAAAAVVTPPGGALAVTGSELLGIAEIARRLSAISHHTLRYEPETAAATRARLGNLPAWKQDLEVGWFEAIEAGEQTPVTDAYRRLTGKHPQTLEEYFAAFPDRLGRDHF